MSPARIIILAILLYLLYRLLFGKKTTSSRPGVGGQLEKDEHNVLVEDPVCHTYVVQGQSLSAVKDGKTYYFCCEECRRKFLEQN